MGDPSVLGSVYAIPELLAVPALPGFKGLVADIASLRFVAVEHDPKLTGAAVDPRSRRTVTPEIAASRPVATAKTRFL